MPTYRNLMSDRIYTEVVPIIIELSDLIDQIDFMILVRTISK